MAQDKQELRAIEGKEGHRLLKALVGVRPSSLNRALNEAIDQYLESESTREPIDRHNLEE